MKLSEYLNIRHLLLRFLILIGIPAVTIIISVYGIIPCKSVTDTDSMYSGILMVYVVMLEFFVIAGLVLLEAIYLHLKKRKPERNADLILAMLFAIYSVVHVLFLRQ